MSVLKLKLPVARMISGDLYTPRTQTDNRTGKPVLDKENREVKKFSFGIAIPKQGETHWNQTVWGKPIWDEGVTAYGNLTQRHDFSWKIDDGDSEMPNTKGKRHCDRVGAPGCWLMWFSPDQSYPVKIVDKDTNMDVTAPGHIVPGYFVQLYIDVIANGSLQKPAQTPGIYVNPIVMAKMGEGARIVPDVDMSDVTFDQNVTLPGMMPNTPPEYSFGNQPPPPQYAQAPAAAAAQPQYAQAPAAAAAQPQYAQAPAAAAAQPQADPRFLEVPPAAPAGPVMTAKAGNLPYESFIAAGWTDEQLRVQGYIV